MAVHDTLRFGSFTADQKMMGIADKLKTNVDPLQPDGPMEVVEHTPHERHVEMENPEAEAARQDAKRYLDEKINLERHLREIMAERDNLEDEVRSLRPLAMKEETDALETSEAS